ncbi:TonB-dependent receptor plug, partial [Psychroflexus gondwanensis ACAM 44]
AKTTQDELRLLVETNRESANIFRDKSFSLILHTLKGSKVFNLNFEKYLSFPFLFNLKEFTPGMNILTLIDPDKKVIAERIFFNYNNLPITTFSSPKIKASLDSLEIQMKPKMALDSIKVSVSVLPKNSIANQHKHSITSYLLLQPYIRGVVQQADWYFNAVDKHKIQELDKLLITQGWSAYDWGSIFNSDFEIRYKSENLLEFEATLNKPTGENQEFLIHASNSSSPQVVNIPANKKSFIINNFFHFEDDELAISKMQGNQLLPANLYVRFSPNTYPDFKTNAPFVQPKVEKTSLNYTQDQPQVLFGKDREVLDEVVLVKRVDKVKERERKLGAEKWGRVSVINYDDITLFQTLGRYLDSKPGIRANENGGGLSVVNLSASNRVRPDGNTPQGPQLYLDDVPLDGSFFGFYSLDNVDYVEINLRGFGGSFLDVNGSIKIYSRFTSVFESSKTVNPQKFNYPVAFSQQKQYYIPKFESYTSDFYQNYGVVDWKPLLKLNAAGEISFKIKKPQVDYQLIIQGISSNGTLIQDVQQINVEK